MSKLAEFRALERQLAQQLNDLENLKSDSSLKKEIEFESKLKAMMTEYKQDLRGIIAILDPHASRRAPAVEAKQRKGRVIKRYKNPETGEVVETKGGNHKILKQWKQAHGADVVESWLQ